MDKFNLKKYLAEGKLLKEEQMGSYRKFLKVVKSYEDEEILSDFLDSYPKGQDISKSEYERFTEKHLGLSDPEDYRGKNWKYIMSEGKLLKENIKSASELLANKEEFDKVVDELAQNIISNGSWDGQHPNSLFKAKGEDFIHPSYVIPSSPPESKDEIAKMFGVSIEDVKTEEEGPSTNASPGVNFIIMGDSQKIKSIANSKGIKAEDNEDGGVKIFGKISTEDWNAYSMLTYDVHMKVRDLKKQLAK